jgi:glycine/D-amino acid oxidase-like deaminating enzyme
MSELLRPTTYAIDYDGTWTTDPEAFQAFAALLRRRGHTVIIVTSRVTGWSEVNDACGRHVDDIVMAGRAWKREAAKSAGYKVDVWIDDRPEIIGRAPSILEAGDRA